MDDSATTIQLRRRPASVGAVTEFKPSSQGVLCAECGRKLSRPGDLKRHKCLIERAKPIEQQKDVVQCGGCQKWFLSKGDLGMHSVKEKTLVHSNYVK